MSVRKLIPVANLGEPTVDSPLRRSSTPGDGSPKFTPEERYIRSTVEVVDQEDTGEEFLFEKAGAREKLFFVPAQTKVAIVTCGGLCPGLNNVIRSIFVELYWNYGVREVWGIRNGYMGLNPDVGDTPVKLTREMISSIHEEGGTAIGSSRGPQDPAVMVDFLLAHRFNALFCIGGDGTLRGAHAIYEEVARRKAKISIIGVPKTIDNDINYCDRSFGLLTAIAEAKKVLTCAHVEAKGAPNGIGLVKVMGRGAGFIAAGATLASQDVNFTLVPEVPFKLLGEKGFLPVLRQRMIDRRHSVVVVAEGAGQHLFQEDEEVERDASGNVRFEDIGIYMKKKISDYFNEHGPKVDIKYIDPSYIIRSVPANCEDSILCDQFGRRAAHAAMAGKTDIVIGHMSDAFAHVPISMATEKKRQMDIEGELWGNVLSATGQPRHFE